MAHKLPGAFCIFSSFELFLCGHSRLSYGDQDGQYMLKVKYIKPYVEVSTEHSSLGAEQVSSPKGSAYPRSVETGGIVWGQENGGCNLRPCVQLDRGLTRQRQPSYPFDSLFLCHHFWVKCFGSCVAIGLNACLWQCGKTECASCWWEIKKTILNPKAPYAWTQEHRLLFASVVQRAQSTA